MENTSFKEWARGDFQITADVAMEQALRFRLRNDNIRVSVSNNVATFEGNTKYTEDELKAIVEEVRHPKL